MTKTIPISINLDTCTSDSEVIMFRGDAVYFNITLNSNGSTSITTSNIFKVRVLCKSAKLNKEEVWFSGESTEITATQPRVATVYFDSDKTSGYSGNAILSITLLSAVGENVICSCTLPFIMQESGYDGLFEASDGFKTQTINTITEVGNENIDRINDVSTILLNDINTATESNLAKIDNATNSIISDINEVVTDAKNEIANWGDQTARLDKTETDLQNLQFSKANNGVLHFYGGSLAVGNETDSMPTTFSWCRTVKMNWSDWEALADFTFFDGNSTNFSNVATDMGAGLYKRNNNSLSFAYSNGTQNYYTYLTSDETKLFFDGKIHTICLCASNGSIKLYRDGLLIKTMSVNLVSIASTKRNFRIEKINAEYSRIYNFNFDITADNAPYTLEDYQNGKPIPPNILDGIQTSLALSDCIANKTVIDYSGNKRYASITGDVYGSNDVKLDLIDTKIMPILNTKANTGVLHFNGGNAQCSKLGLQQKQPFSFAVRIKANKNDVLIKKQVNIIDMGVFYLYIHSSVQRLSVYATGNSLQSVTAEQNDRIFDGNWHSLFVTYDGTTLTLLDEFGVLLTVNYSIQEQTSGTLFGSNFVGQMKDICIFNFDMSADDAPYTIADYKNGKAIPPKAFYGQNSFVGGIEQSYSWLRSGLKMKSNITFDENGTNFIFDNTNGTSADYQVAVFNVNIPKGACVSIEGDWASIYAVYLYYGSVTPIQLIDNGKIINNHVTNTENCTVLRIRPLSTPAGSTKTITLPPSCKIKVNGAILALEDYTFNNEVLDYSGNNNHATVTGNVMGDCDTKIETFYQKVATRISNNI